MISVFFEFLTRGLIWIFRTIFDMITFFLRQLFRLLRLFFVLLPLTGIVYCVFYLMLLTEVVAGENVISSLLPLNLDGAGIRVLIMEALKGYLGLMNGYSGTLMYFVLLMLLLILAIPLFLTFVAIGTFAFSGIYLMILALVDLFAYLIGSVVTGIPAGKMIGKRYLIFFPESGRRFNQKSYYRWLSRHRDEFDSDTYGTTKKKSPLEEFYEEDSDDNYDEYGYSDQENDQYDDEYDEEYDDSEYEEYEEYDNADSPVYAEDEYEEDLDNLTEYGKNYDYDRHYDSGRHYNRRIDDKRRTGKASGRKTAADPQSVSSFNFFAGCNSLESASKKYRSLVKLYHPDNMDGDTTALQEINAQYEEIKKRL